MPVVGTSSITSSCRLFGVPDKVLGNVRGVQGLVCAQMLNLVSRGKGDGPQVFFLNVVSKDGGHLSRGFFVNWKIHVQSFEWKQRLLKSINGKALLRAWFQLRINNMARGTYYWIISIVFQMTISLFLCPVYACADLHSD